MKKRFVLIALVAVLAGCATTPAPVSVADTIARDPQLSTLHGLVQKAGLAEPLQAGGPYTVFAPTNEAFSKVPARTLDELGRDPARLKDVLSYHVLPGKVLAADVTIGNVKTTQGAILKRQIVTVAGVPQIIYKIPLREVARTELKALNIPSLIDRVIIGPTPHAMVVVALLADAGVPDARKRVCVSTIPLRQA